MRKACLGRAATLKSSMLDLMYTISPSSYYDVGRPEGRYALPIAHDLLRVIKTDNQEGMPGENFVLAKTHPAKGCS